MEVVIALRELIEFGSRTAEKIFAFRKCYEPMWHAITADGEHKVIVQTLDDKDAQMALVLAAFELFNVVAYLFISEAWSLVAKPSNQAERDRLVDEYTHDGIRDNPNRVEILWFQAEDRTGMLVAHREIIRPAKGKPTLGPLEFEDMDGWTAEGRIMGLLPRPADARMQ